MPKRKTNEEFIKELTEKFPNFPIIPIDEYYNNNTKIRCKCLIHKDIVQTTPKRLLKGHNCCPKCLREIKHNSRVGTNEEFLQKLKYNNIDVIPLEKYSGYNTKILFKCTCGDLWLTTPQRVLLGNHCKKGNNTKKQFIEFVEKLFDENRISLKKYNELINKLNQIK